MGTIRVSNGLDPDQDRRFVGPDLDPNCLQRLSATLARKELILKRSTWYHPRSIDDFFSIILIVILFKITRMFLRKITVTAGYLKAEFFIFFSRVFLVFACAWYGMDIRLQPFLKKCNPKFGRVKRNKCAFLRLQVVIDCQQLQNPSKIADLRCDYIYWTIYNRSLLIAILGRGKWNNCDFFSILWL